MKKEGKNTNKKREEPFECDYCEQEVVCRFCGSSNIREIIYGLLGGDITGDEFQSRYRVGGCEISGDDVRYYCANCKKNFGKIYGAENNWHTALPKIYSKIEKLEKEKEKLEIKVAWLNDTLGVLKESVRDHKKYLNRSKK